MVNEQRKIFQAAAERRNLNGKDVQPVVQVFPELASADHRHQFTIRRGDHAQIQLACDHIADTAQLPVLQHAQQLGLKTPRRVRDFVEEQRPSVGFFEQSGLIGNSRGERAALVAEQFAFDQIVRQRTAIDRNELSGAAFAVLVYGSRDKLLTRTRLSGHKHGSGDTCCRSYFVSQGLHC